MPDSAIPAEIMSVNHWVVWKYEQRNGKATKVPYNPVTGEKASTTDERTWSVYESAEACARSGRASGVGFVFTATDDFVGIDLDQCRDPETGEIARWAADIVVALHSYTEITPSGAGLHILCRGKLPPGRRRKDSIEIYETARYFTITGKALPGLPLRLEERTAELERLHAEVFGDPDLAKQRSPLAALPDPDEWAVIERILKNPSGAFLWRGDTSGYASASEADLALAGLVAFYCGPDETLIRRVLYRSNLVREKWDRRGDDYLERTIKKALDGKSDFYEWSTLNSSNSLNSSHRSAEVVREGSLNSFNSLNSYDEPSDSTDPAWPPDLAPEAFYGIGGDIAQALAPETEADPVALLLNFLVVFGNVIGRSPHCHILTSRHGTNLFAALVGLTGEGSKGTSWDPIRWIFHRAFPEYVDERIVGGVASGEGLISFVRDRRERRAQVKDKKTGRMTMEFETIVEDEGVQDKRCLILEAEMSGLLKIMNRPGNVLSEQLRQAWDRGDLHNLSKNSPIRATGAHISLLGHITPHALKTHLTEAEAANGFANRFLWMLVRRSQYLPEGGVLPYLNTYISNIYKIVEEASEGYREITKSEETKRIWAAVYPDLRRAEPGLVGELIARRAPIVTRLALTYCAADGLRTMLPEHLFAALAVWQRSETSVRVLFGGATGDSVADALYAAMKARPEGATRTDLHAALGRNRAVSEIDRGLAVLSETARARAHRQKGEGGREVEVWVPLAAAPGAGTPEYLEKAKAVYENNDFNENSGG